MKLLKLIIPVVLAQVIRCADKIAGGLSTQGRPDLCSTGEPQYTGYLEATSNDRVFYWLTRARNNQNGAAPVVLWINGGPGASSALGQFTGIGPCRIINATHVEENPHSWNEWANLLVIDQPIGVGFSYGSAHLASSDAVAELLLQALTKFYERHPELRSNPLHIFGESYAGHTLPRLAKQLVLSRNKFPQFQSVGLGNPLLDHEHQFVAYKELQCSDKVDKVDSVLAIDSQSPDNCQIMDQVLPLCIEKINQCRDQLTVNEKSAVSSDDEIGVEKCATAYDFCFENFVDPYFFNKGDVYNMRDGAQETSKRYRNISEAIQNYLNQPYVQDQLFPGSPNRRRFKMKQPMMSYEFMMSGDLFASYHEDIDFLLESGIRLLVYVGADDFMCSYRGTLRAVQHINHYKRNMVRHTHFTTNTINDLSDNALASVMSAGNLTLIKIDNASHIVPLDHPELIQSIVNQWILPN